MPSSRGRNGLPASRALDRPAIIEVLAAAPMFRGLPADALERLAGICTTRTFGRGQYLWYQGDEGDRLMIVAAGLLKVVVTTEQGDELVLFTLDRGAAIGELSLLDGAPRSASAVAVEPTTVLMLTRATILGLLADNPAVLDAVLSALSQMVRRLTEQVQDLSFLDLPGRLSKVLIRLAERHAGAGGAMVIDLGMSQSELAAMVGASRPAVNRVLHRFADRGLITVDGQRIVLRDLAGLHERAGY